MIKDFVFGAVTLFILAVLVVGVLPILWLFVAFSNYIGGETYDLH